MNSTFESESLSISSSSEDASLVVSLSAIIHGFPVIIVKKLLIQNSAKLPNLNI